MHSNKTWLFGLYFVCVTSVIKEVNSTCNSSPPLLINYTSISTISTIPAPIDVSAHSTYSISGHFKWTPDSISKEQVLLSIFDNNKASLEVMLNSYSTYKTLHFNTEYKNPGTKKFQTGEEIIDGSGWCFFSLEINTLLTNGSQGIRFNLKSSSNNYVKIEVAMSFAPYLSFLGGSRLLGFSRTSVNPNNGHKRFKGDLFNIRLTTGRTLDHNAANMNQYNEVWDLPMLEEEVFHFGDYPPHGLVVQTLSGKQLKTKPAGYRSSSMLTDMAFRDSKLDFRGLWRKLEIEDILPLNHLHSYTLHLRARVSHVMRVSSYDSSFSYSLLSMAGSLRRLSLLLVVTSVLPDKSLSASFALLDNGVQRTCSQTSGLIFDSSSQDISAFLHLRCLPVDSTCKAILEASVFDIVTDKHETKLKCEVSLSRGDFANLLNNIQVDIGGHDQTFSQLVPPIFEIVLSEYMVIRGGGIPVEKQASYAKDCVVGQAADYIIGHHIDAHVSLNCHPASSAQFGRECHPFDSNPAATGCLINNRTDTTKCIKCSTGHTLINGVCQECTAGCFLCLDSSVCSVCRQGWILDQQTNHCLKFDAANFPTTFSQEIYVPALQTAIMNGTITDNLIKTSSFDGSHYIYQTSYEVAELGSVIYHATIKVVENIAIESLLSHFDFVLKWNGQIMQTRSVPTSVTDFDAKITSFDILTFDVSPGTHLLSIEGLYPFQVIDQRFNSGKVALSVQQCSAGCAECPNLPTVCTICQESYSLWNDRCLTQVRFEVSVEGTQLRLRSNFPVTPAQLKGALLFDYQASLLYIDTSSLDSSSDAATTEFLFGLELLEGDDINQNISIEVSLAKLEMNSTHLFEAISLLLHFTPQPRPKNDSFVAAQNTTDSKQPSATKTNQQTKTAGSVASVAVRASMGISLMSMSGSFSQLMKLTQYVELLVYFNVELPSNLASFLQYFSQDLFGKLLNPMKDTGDSKCTPPTKFREAGNDCLILQNSGEVFILLAALIFIKLGLAILSPKLKLFERLSSSMNSGWFVMVIDSFFLDIARDAILNISLAPTRTIYSLFNLAISAGVLVCLITMTFWLFYKCFYGSLAYVHDALDTMKWSGRYFIAIQEVNSLICVVAVILTQRMPLLHILLVGIMHFSLWLCNTVSRPQKNLLEFYKSTLSNFIISFCMLGTALFTNGTKIERQTQERLGLAMIVGLSILFTLTILCNLIESAKRIITLYHSLRAPRSCLNPIIKKRKPSSVQQTDNKNTIKRIKRPTNLKVSQLLHKPLMTSAQLISLPKETKILENPNNRIARLRPKIKRLKLIEGSMLNNTQRNSVSLYSSKLPKSISMIRSKMTSHQSQIFEPDSSEPNGGKELLERHFFASDETKL